ncbi:MAG: hypothetical protein DRP74_08310 [Candidatus Omnitrophota bacterium]|nr:MAG: hypothetical protein DRP74_08310 [Candidatus Omnitrophota bacterium]
MTSEKFFLIFIAISAAVHTAILFFPGGMKKLNLDKLKREVEVSYLKIPAQKKETQATLEEKKESFLKSTHKALAKKAPPPFINKEVILKKDKKSLFEKLPFTKPAFVRPNVIAVKKKVTLPPIVDIDKINNPSYISYYQIVREKIRRAAYNNYLRSETGQVYCSFVIASDGNLLQARLVKDKSSANAFLKENALKSIKDASPFPVFPEELGYSQLSFNVIISFEIE